MGAGGEEFWGEEDTSGGEECAGPNGEHEGGDDQSGIEEVGFLHHSSGLGCGLILAPLRGLKPDLKIPGRLELANPPGERETWLSVEPAKLFAVGDSGRLVVIRRRRHVVLHVRLVLGLKLR